MSARERWVNSSANKSKLDPVWAGFLHLSFIMTPRSFIAKQSGLQWPVSPRSQWSLTTPALLRHQNNERSTSQRTFVMTRNHFPYRHDIFWVCLVGQCTGLVLLKTAKTTGQSPPGGCSQTRHPSVDWSKGYLCLRLKDHKRNITEKSKKICIICMEFGAQMCWRRTPRPQVSCAGWAIYKRDSNYCTVSSSSFLWLDALQHSRMYTQSGLTCGGGYRACWCLKWKH